MGLCMPWGSTRPTLANVVAHELVGHGFEIYVYGARAAQISEMQTIREVDRIYQSAVPGMPLRCGH